MGNCFVKLCLRLLACARGATPKGSSLKVRCFLEHPEDLGALLRKGKVVRPASIWQLEELRLQVGPESGRKTRVVWQCGFEAP